MEEPISQIQFSVQSFEPHLPIDLLDVVEIVEFRTPDRPPEKAMSEFLFSQFLASTSASASYNFCSAALPSDDRVNSPFKAFVEISRLSTSARRYDLDLSSLLTVN